MEKHWIFAVAAEIKKYCLRAQENSGYISELMVGCKNVTVFTLTKAERIILLAKEN